MQLRIRIALAALVLVPIAACGDSGGTTQGTTTPGAEASAFDDYFGFGDRALAANESTGASQEECLDDNCSSGSTTEPATPEYTPPVCESPLAPPAGGLAECQAFCAKVTGCMGAPEAEAACATDCNASLAGMELAAVKQIFGCFTAASCDDLDGWGGGSSDATQGDTRTDVPPDASGSSGGSETPVPADDNSSADPVPPREGGGEVIVEADPIGECVDAVFTSWLDADIGDSKQAVCDAVPANEARCAGTNSTVIEVSSGEASASSGSTPEGDANDSAGDSAGGSDGADPADQQAPARDQDPLPAEEPTAEDYADAAEECHAYGSLLSGQTMARIGACDAMEDCAARQACLDQVLVCAPFIELLDFGGGAAVSNGVGEPSRANPEPTTPTDPDPA